MEPVGMYGLAIMGARTPFEGMNPGVLQIWTHVELSTKISPTYLLYVVSLLYLESRRKRQKRIRGVTVHRYGAMRALHTCLLACLSTIERCMHCSVTFLSDFSVCYDADGGLIY